MFLFAITTSKCWISNWTTVKQMLFVSNDRRMMSGKIRRVISGGLPMMKCVVCYTQFQMLNKCF